MKKLNWAFLIFIIIGVEASIGSTPTSIQVKIDDFLKTTGLKLENYKYESGDDECHDGELKIIASEDHFTLMLGANGLIHGLGREDYTIKEEGCTTKFKNEFSFGEVIGNSEQICRGHKVERRVALKVVGKDLVYTREVKNGKNANKETCTLITSSR